MRAFALDPGAVTPEAIAGRVLCNDVVGAGPDGRVRLGKGRVLVATDAAVLRSSARELHLLALEPGDIHEDEASIRLAEAIRGPGLTLRPPVESQSYLRASHRGIVGVQAEALNAINCLPDVSIYTLYHGQPVTEDRVVAAAKVTPLAAPEPVILQAERLAAEHAPIVRVWPYLGLPVGVVVREGIKERARVHFEESLRVKIGYFGSPLGGILYPPGEVDAIAAAIEGLIANGCALILAAGVNSTDPLDPTLLALGSLHAVTERRGVPAHPGSTCWLAYAGDTPIFGLALCGMISQTTVLDILLPRFLAGWPVRAQDIAGIGHGGVLGKEMAFRFPAYGAGSADGE